MRPLVFDQVVSAFYFQRKRLGTEKAMEKLGCSRTFLDEVTARYNNPEESFSLLINDLLIDRLDIVGYQLEIPTIKSGDICTDLDVAFGEIQKHFKSQAKCANYLGLTRSYFSARKCQTRRNYRLSPYTYSRLEEEGYTIRLVRKDV